MQLKSAQIENYKIVEDSTEFSVDQVTCLVGKNESGKSAILEALYKLKPVEASETSFESLDFPRRRLSAAEQSGELAKSNVLTTRWELEQSDLDALVECFGVNPVTENIVTVTKGYNNRRSWTIVLDEAAVVRHLTAKSKLNQTELEALPKTAVRELFRHLEQLTEPSEAQTAFLTELAATFPDKYLNTAVQAQLAGRLPTFVYFTDYYRMPGRVALQEISRLQAAATLSKEDEVFLSFLKLANANLDEFEQAGTNEQLIVKLEGVSNRITEEIFEYWSQNKHLEVEFRFDQGRPEDPAPFNQGSIFNTRIRNTRHKASVSFEQRSTGFIWFFSFLVWFSQVREEYGENLLILLDEPGLALHAKAQADLLRYINEKLKPHYQVIYSTHSPFMIDASSLLSVRTVEDRISEDSNGRTRIEGTKVGDKVLSIDADTIMPLYGALGYDITQTLFVGANTLLVEGPSDLLYIIAMSDELGRLKRTRLDARWTIAPTGGLDKVMSFVILFTGKKLHIAVLADYHAGDKAKVQRLRETEILKSGHVLTADTYAGQSEADIEDLFTRDGYIELVNQACALTKTQRIPTSRPSDAPIRCVAEAEDRIRLLPSVPQFNHYVPAQYLVEHMGELRTVLPGWSVALDRFEKLFVDLNALL
ncbi:MAG: ATP-dependent nuclease [Fimbriimonadaceae bacterium]